MLIKQSIFLDDSLSFDKMLLTVKEIVSKSKILKQDNEQLQIGNILLDRNERALVQKGVKTQLTGKEFHLLELLMINAGRVTTRESIIDHVWDRRNFVSQNTIEAYISRLRKKLNEKKNKGYIQTIPCLGYSFKHA
jgi:DNA-binding response OmpR family regulator